MAGDGKSRLCRELREVKFRRADRGGVTGKEVELKFSPMLDGVLLSPSHIAQSLAATSNPVVHFSTNYFLALENYFSGRSLSF